jgi:hypothetical protein
VLINFFCKHYLWVTTLQNKYYFFHMF